MARVLAVFDFDHTVIDQNSDVVLRDLLPENVLEDEKLKGLRPSWTAYMAEIFRLLPQHGVNRQTILNTCQHLKPTQGMLELFQYLSDIDAEIIVISDANSIIISTWLEHNLPLSKIQVFTNPAVWTEEVLKVSPYQQQTFCKTCPINLCKGSVLSKFLETRPYDIVAYIGDGKNDYCPAQSLRECDLVFPRSLHRLEAILEENSIRASVHVWTTATQIKSQIYQVLL